MAGTKLFIVTVTFGLNLCKYKRWSSVWNCRLWLCVQEMSSSINCGRLGTGRRCLPLLWYFSMVPPLPICRPAFGYCRLASHTKEINSSAFLPLGEKPCFHNNRMLYCTQSCRKSFGAANIFFFFFKTCQNFVDCASRIFVPIRFKVSDNYI